MQNDKPEHWLDASDLAYRNRQTTENVTNAFRASQIKASISAFTLILIQDILRPGDIDILDSSNYEAAEDSAILCTASFSIKAIDASYLRVLATGAQFRFGQTQAQAIQQTASFTSGRVRLQVQHTATVSGHAVPQNAVIGVPTAAPGTVLNLSVQGGSGSLHLSSDTVGLAVEVSESSLDFVNSAAELVTGTVHSWFVVARVIEREVLQAQYRVLPTYRRLVTDILQLAHDEGIATDPLFLNRPTIMPLSARADLSWKVSAHIRHCLRQLSSQAHATLRDGLITKIATKSEVDFRVIVPLLQEWHSWELDPVTIRNLTLFGYLFPRQASKQAVSSTTPVAPFSWDTPAQINMQLGLFKAAFYDEERCANRMQIKPSEIFGFYTGRSVKQLSVKTSIALRISLGSLTVELDPSFVGLVRHVGRVRRTFETKLAPLILKPQVADFTQIPRKASPTQVLQYAPPSSLPIIITVFMQSIDLMTQAQDVRASSSFQGIHGCVSAAAAITAAETTIALDGEAFMGVNSVRVVAATDHESRGFLKPVTGSTLVSVQLQDISLHACMQARSTDSIELRITCSIASSRIRIPRSILRMSQL